MCAIHNLPSTAKRKLVVLVELVAWGPYAKRSHCHTLIFFFGQSYIDIYILFFGQNWFFFLVEIKIDIYILQSVLLLSFFFWSTYCCYLFFVNIFAVLKGPLLSINFWHSSEEQRKPIPWQCIHTRRKILPSTKKTRKILPYLLIFC